MRWFRRQKWVELGTYEPPEPSDPAPIERVVDDGMLIAEAVIRMTLRNRVIVDALRDRRNLDREALSALAAAELEALADNEWESAERIRFRRDNKRVDDPLQDGLPTEAELRESRRREEVHRAMSEAFAARAKQRDILDAVVERARSEAWEEVAPVIVDRAGHPEPEVDAGYAQELPERVATFLALDLMGLAAERGVEL